MNPQQGSEPRETSAWRRLLKANPSDEAVRDAKANVTGFFELLNRWQKAHQTVDEKARHGGEP
jgi:hypothetical protein